MIGRQPTNMPELFVLPPLRVPDNICPHCKAYQWDRECRERAGKQKYWHCCSNGNVNPNLQTPESDDAAIDALPDGPVKEEARILAARVKDQLDRLLYETEPHPDHPNDATKRTRTARSKKFQEWIVAYNNVLSFTSESAKVDHIHSAFSTFRCMGGIRHLIGALLPNPGDWPKFCQIYTVDSSQEQLERRMMDDTGGNVLDAEVMRVLQRLMGDINPYARAFKSCAQRLAENPNPNAKVHLKQNDPGRLARGTHNKPTSGEVAALIVMPENLDGEQPIERDILVQNQDGGLLSIPYWQSCYMPLRYPLIFPHGEQSWNAKIPLNDFAATDSLLARRVNRGETRRHGMPFLDDGGPLQDIRPEEDEEGDNGVHETGKRYGKGGSTRTTLAEFYRFLLQVSQFARIRRVSGPYPVAYSGLAPWLILYRIGATIGLIAYYILGGCCSTSWLMPLRASSLTTSTGYVRTSRSCELTSTLASWIAWAMAPSSRI